MSYLEDIRGGITGVLMQKILRITSMIIIFIGSAYSPIR